MKVMYFCRKCDASFNELEPGKVIRCGTCNSLLEYNTPEPPKKNVRGPCLATVCGDYFWFQKPREFDYKIATIAHGLSKICRFGGQCDEFYSVAQHSVLASLIVAHPFMKHALMHDAQEAFFGDMPRPLKELFPDFRIMEKECQLAIFAHFGLEEKEPDAVKHADLIMLATEKRDLMTHTSGDLWTLLEGINPMPAIIKPWPPKVAREMFLQRFHSLWGAV